MDPRYSAWIAEHYPTQESAYGQCAVATKEMVAAFPELRRTRGHYYCVFGWGERAHWWCVTEAGDVVDPTARQFPSVGTGEYAELDPNAPIPTGKCPECGELVYENETFCSPRHEAIYVAYMTTGVL